MIDTWKYAPRGTVEVICMPHVPEERYGKGPLTRELIEAHETPEALEQVRAALEPRKPVGTHDRMTDVILARAEEVVEQFPFPRAPKAKEITLIIAGHGTERNHESRQSIDRQVALIRSKQIYAAVQAVFMDEEPRIADCYSLAPTRNLVIVPFFISDGLHTMADIPVLLGEPDRIVKERLAAGQPTWRNPCEKHGKLVWYSPAVGSALLVAEVILERVREAVFRSKL